MAEIRNKNTPDASDQDADMKHGVPKGAATEETPGGYGGTDRLQSEAAPLHPEAATDEAKDGRAQPVDP
jgi:hypothetical protein